jgi:hypothetical protein
MKQMTVTGTQTLIAAPGNRDFCAIYNNGPQICYLCFDGDDGISSMIPSVPLSTGFLTTTLTTSIQVTAANATGILVGQLISGTGIPGGVYVTGISPLPNQNIGAVVVTITCTSFTSTAGSTGNYTFGQLALTTSNGFPLPANTWMDLDNSAFRNVQNHAIYAISAGSSDLRIQGGA